MPTIAFCRSRLKKDLLTLQPGATAHLSTVGIAVFQRMVIRLDLITSHLLMEMRTLQCYGEIKLRCTALCSIDAIACWK